MRTLTLATLSLFLLVAAGYADAQPASQPLTRAAVKAETAKSSKAAAAPVDSYDQSPSAPAHSASAPRFHLRRHPAASATSASH